MDELVDRLGNSLANRYSIEHEIGSGGFAKVFLGNDEKHHRKVAIKVLRPELAAAIGPDRFQREIEIAAPLVHPHILPIHDSGEADGLLYYVMPYVQGESLRQKLARVEQLRVDDAVAIAREVADGLEYAHRSGVVHRDIKPDNILLTEGHAVVMDFGVAKAVASAGADKLTASGLVIGSPAYMSPEQAGGTAEVDARTDVYALGCVLYEMLAGKPPFTGGPAQAVIVRQMVEDAPPLQGVRSDVPAAVAQAVDRALSKKPDERFASAAEFAEALVGSPSGVTITAAAPAVIARWKGWFVGWHRVAFVLLVLGVLGTAITVVRERLLEPGSAYAVPNPRQSFVVLPFATRVPTAEEDSLTARAADELTRQLNGWELARAVSNVALAGPLFDLGLSVDGPSQLDDAIALARSVSVGTLVVLTVRVLRDSAVLEAELFDASSSEPLVGSPLQSLPFPKSDVYSMVAPLANEILGLSGAPEQLEGLRRQSNDPQAVSQLQDGINSLERWRLDEAKDHFRGALERDSAFALAHHYLGLTLYWQGSGDRNRQAELGPEAAGHSRAARRHAAGLPPNTLTPAQAGHIQAFASFNDGDYLAARDLYHELIAGDSTDVYSWLLLGSVEYLDPWLTEDRSDRQLPRQDLNLAVRAFSETVRLSPDFYLGYGHLFDIYLNLLLASEAGFRGYGFERPRDELIPPWEYGDPRRQVYFYPVVQDSIHWVRSARSEEFKQVSRAGAQSLLENDLRRLERWAAYAPDEAKPREELAKWHLARRRYMPAPTRASLTRAAEEALRHTTAALALRGDTAPEDLARLGALYLATDSLELANTQTERALEELRSDAGSFSRPPPRVAANIFLAQGQPSRAIEILRPYWRPGSRAVFDTLEARTITYGGAESVYGKVRVYGATGLAGDSLRQAFAELEAVWSEPNYPPRDVFLLRDGVTRSLGPVLVADVDLRRDWFDGWDTTSPIWSGYLRSGSDRDSTREWLERSADTIVRDERGAEFTAYVLGALAEQSGADSLAIQLFGQFDAQPLTVGAADLGWGLRSLSHYYLAKSHERTGEVAAAIRHYERFEELWRNAEIDLQPLLDEARKARSRLQQES